jgi:Chagasin family peptidase inhibitor I42.
VATRQGYTFTVKLTSAPTTGVDWFFDNKKELKDYVQLINSEFVSSPSLVKGRIGKKIFTFKALKDGKIIIKFIKRKSWEDKEIDHKLVKVHIKKADLNTAPSI